MLTITEMLRKHGVVGKFVEFYGPGVSALPLANRATIGNMSPEFGSTIAVFPIDEQTVDYLAPHRPPRGAARARRGLRQGAGPLARPERRAALQRAARARRLDRRPVARRPEASAGPRRGHQGQDELPEGPGRLHRGPRPRRRPSTLDGQEFEIGHGAVTIAAITSCTNTSNPSVMIGAALLAKNAVDKGLSRKPWVKTTLAPGSKVVSDYYEKSGLTPYLDKLGFNLVGYGCTTCIGNSGPLIPEVSAAVNEADLAVVSVLSGNRNFEGRINPDIKMNYLASPPLVVAYALAGSMDLDLFDDPLGQDQDGNDVFLKDIWPSPTEVEETIAQAINSEMFGDSYKDVFAGDERWQSLPTPEGNTFEWDEDSTYVRRPPYFDGMPDEPEPVTDIDGARVLLKLGDSVTTDHISPAGAIKKDSPAGRYLAEHGVEQRDFNSYGSRRGNHEVMIRGTFANIRLRNQLAPGTEGGVTRDFTADGDGDQRLRGRASTTTPPARRWSSWRARSTAPARRATGRPRAPRCSASRPSSPSPTSASTAPT